MEKAAAAHPELNLTAEKIGFQPWQVKEVYERLKAGLREYRKLVAANQDTKPAETAILFYAGWLGHYVADGSQPLHDTIQYNGWTGPNPNGYTTEHKIHSQFETAFVIADSEDVRMSLRWWRRRSRRCWTTSGRITWSICGTRTRWWRRRISWRRRVDLLERGRRRAMRFG